jgi:hypothetical protein
VHNFNDVLEEWGRTYWGPCIHVYNALNNNDERAMPDSPGAENRVRISNIIGDGRSNSGILYSVSQYPAAHHDKGFDSSICVRVSRNGISVLWNRIEGNAESSICTSMALCKYRGPRY